MGDFVGKSGPKEIKRDWAGTTVRGVGFIVPPGCRWITRTGQMIKTAIVNFILAVRTPILVLVSQVTNQFQAGQPGFFPGFPHNRIDRVFSCFYRSSRNLDARFRRFGMPEDEQTVAVGDISQDFLPYNHSGHLLVGGRVQPQFLDRLLAHQEFLDFAGDGHREGFGKLEVARYLEVGNLAFTEGF